MIYLIIALFGVAVASLVAMGARILAVAGVRYRETFKTRARANLAELYVFIEPEKVFTLNIIILMIAALITLLLSGSMIVAGLVGIGLGFMPPLVFRRLRARRIDRIMEQLPDSLVSLSASLKAGSSLVQGLEVTVREEAPPVSQELGLLLKELRVGVSFAEALDNMGRRVATQDMDLVIAGMKISREVGGNLAEVLDRLASTVRRKREMEGKIDALTSQGRMQGVVMTALPFLLAAALWHIEGEHMHRLFTDPIGWGALVVIAVLVSTGFFFIRKIVNIDV